MTRSLPLDETGSQSFRIPDIVKLVDDGTFRIPTFQRDFVWEAANVRDLFDSVYRGFPIGTVLLWKHRANAQTYLIGSYEVEGEDDPNALWVVDGQQRITSFFAALTQRGPSTDDRFEIYFDLSSRRFINSRRGTAPLRAIPVRQALETKTLLHWYRTHEDDLEPDDTDVADDLAGKIREYRVPAYIVTGDDQRLLREVFDRVNSAGKSITRAQVFHALFASDSENASPAAVSRELAREGFGTIEENRIVQSLLAIRGGDVQRDIHDEFGDDESPDEWYDKTTSALTAAIRFLRDEGVPHLLLTPNTLPLPVLSVFFYLHPQPEPWTLRLLSRWLWRGWVHGFGREGGQTPTLRRAIRSVHPRTGEVDQAPDEYEAVRLLLEFTPDRPAPELSMSGFRTNTANGRLILLSMLSQNPMNINGTRIDVAKSLEERGVDAITQLIPGFRTNAAARGFWPNDVDIERAVDAGWMVASSHLLSGALVRKARDGEYEDFVRSRGEALSVLTYKFLQARLDPNAILRPSLEQLALRGAGAEDGEE